MTDANETLMNAAGMGRNVTIVKISTVVHCPSSSRNIMSGMTGPHHGGTACVANDMVVIYSAVFHPNSYSCLFFLHHEQTWFRNLQIWEIHATFQNSKLHDFPKSDSFGTMLDHDYCIYRDIVLKCIKLWIKRSVHEHDIDGGGGDGKEDGANDEDILADDNCLGPHKPDLCQMCEYLRKPCFRKRK